MKTQTLTINRHGYFRTIATSENQCKEVGFKSYEYKIEIEAKCKLDEHGFIFDQLTIDKSIKEKFLNYISSCEIICNETEKMLFNLLQEKQVEVIRTSVTIKGTGSEASFTLKTNYNTVLLSLISDEYPQQCKICGISFMEEKILQQHILENHF